MNSFTIVLSSFEHVLNSDALRQNLKEHLSKSEDGKIKELAQALKENNPLVIKNLAEAHRFKSIHDLKTIKIQVGEKEELSFDGDSLIALKKIIENVTSDHHALFNEIEQISEKAHQKNNKAELINLQEQLKKLQESAINKLPNYPVFEEKFRAASDEIRMMIKILEIKSIIQKGNSMQGYSSEVLSYEGVKVLDHIKDPHHNGEINTAEKLLLRTFELKETEKALKSLKKVLNFMLDKELGKMNVQSIDQLALSVKNGTASKEEVQLIVDCKKTWMKLMTDQGSYLSILSFVGKEDFKGLEELKKIAFIQGPLVDEALNIDLFQSHLVNRPKHKNPLNVLVEGAGPNGLYAALQFFRNGANVSVVNDRGERVVRNQIISLDPKWVAQLNYFMGSKFNELFVGPNALGSLNPNEESANINTKNLEDIMKIRLAEISSYTAQMKQKYKAPVKPQQQAQQQQQAPAARPNQQAAAYNNNHQNNQFEMFLNVHFEAPLMGIKELPQGYIAVIGEPKPSKDANRFLQAALDGKAQKILNEKFSGRDPEEVVDGEKLIDSAYREARVELDKEKGDVKQSKPNIVFDFLACVGGANDSIRDEYLCPAIPLTAAKNYGIASWIKNKDQHNLHYLNQANFDRLGILKDNFNNPFVTEPQLRESLKKQNLDGVINAFNFPDEMKEKYKNFTEKLLDSVKQAPLQDMDPAKGIYGVNLRAMENNSTIYIGAASPPYLSEFLHDLETLMMNTENPELCKQMQALKKEIDTRWMNALGGVFGIDPKVTPIDTLPVNVGTFDVQQKGIDVAAKTITSKRKNTIIIAAFGDSRASPHFFSGSGMSSGRMGIQNGAKLLKEYNSGHLRTKEEFVGELELGLSNVKKKVIQKGSRFLVQNTPKDRAQASYNKLKQKVHEHFITQEQNKVGIGDTGWRLDTDVDAQGQFELSFVTKEGQVRKVEIEISVHDGLFHFQDKKFSVFNDLVVYLESI